MARNLKVIALLAVGFVAGALLWPDSVAEQRVDVTGATVSGDTIELFVDSCRGNPRALIWDSVWDQEGPVEIEVVAFVKRWSREDCADVLRLPIQGIPPAQLLDSSSGDLVEVDNR